MSARNTNKFLYNPARLPEKDLLARFIVREREFGRIWEDVSRTRRDGIDQHFLVIGQRGMGKTTLMLKIAYEVKRDPKLQDWLIPVNLPEELFGVRDLLGLWEVLAEHLEEQFLGLEKQVQPAIEAGNERAALEAIRLRLKQEGKKLILFIDNFGDLLDRLNEIEVHRLRETLMSANDIRLIAASARLMDHTYQYDKPFFDFFNTVFLDGLDRESSLKLMRGLAENSGQLPLLEQIIAEHPARIEAIRRLTGGVPRLLILLFSSVMGDPDAQLMDDLEDILDQVSPYYKHRVEELPDQQQSIFHHVAMAWDAIGAGEVAEAMRTDSRKVSAQLQSLIDNDLLERVETGGKNHLYRIRERFFNIWYLLRMAGARGASRMRWLVGFLETWLDTKELKRKLEDFALAFREDGRDNEASEIDELLASIYQEENLYQLHLTYDPPFDERLATILTKLENGETPDNVEQRQLIKRAPNWDLAVKTLNSLQEKGLQPIVDNYGALLRHVRTSKDIQWVFNELERLSLEPNFFTYQTLLISAPDWDSAIWVLSEMENKGIPPNVVTFNSLANRAPDWDSAIWVLQEMESKGISPDVVTFNSLINRAPDWDSAMRVLQEMENKGIQPDVVTFNSLINRAPDWDSAMGVLQEMENKGIPTNVVTFNSLINSAPAKEAIITILDRMIEENVVPDHVTYISLWRKAEHHEDMFDLLERLKGMWPEKLSNPKGDPLQTLAIDTATILLWECDFARASELSRASFEANSPNDHHLLRQEFYLLTLLVRYQHQESLNLFGDSPHRLKDVFKPIWYALQKLMGEAGRKELLRMGPELEETVDEIVAWVLRMRRKYPA